MQNFCHGFLIWIKTDILMLTLDQRAIRNETPYF